MPFKNRLQKSAHTCVRKHKNERHKKNCSAKRERQHHPRDASPFCRGTREQDVLSVRNRPRAHRGVAPVASFDSQRGSASRGPRAFALHPARRRLRPTLSRRADSPRRVVPGIKVGDAMSSECILPEMAQRLAARARPSSSPVGRQRWGDLLFLHWKVAANAVQATLPPGLFVDTFEGAAYLGIVPFFMERVRPAWLPPLPWVSWFLELNVRTYVHDREGRPGVWFYSLDCNQPVAVAIARRFFHLPYFHAKMRATRRDGAVEYHSQRHGTPTLSSYAWQPDADTREAAPGSVEFFLVERYVLFSTDRSGDLHCGQVHHRPYLISSAVVTEFSVEPARQAGFELAGPPNSTLCASAVDVSIFALGKL